MIVQETYIVEYKTRYIQLHMGVTQQKEWPHKSRKMWVANFGKCSDWDGEMITEFEEISEESVHELIKNSSI